MLGNSRLLFVAIAAAALGACRDDNSADRQSSQSESPLAIATTGSVERTCAPTDGPQITISLQTDKGSQLVMRLNTTLEEAVGVWDAGHPDEDKGLWVGACDEDSCVEADEATLSIARVTSESVDGNLDVRFGNTEIREHSFTVTVDPTTENLPCG